LQIGRFCLLVVALSMLVAVPVAAAGKGVARQASWRAEVNLLHAPRLIGRWAPSLVNPRTRLVRSNTVVRCRGLGVPVTGRFHTFRCSIRGGKAQLAVRYTALSVMDFRATKLAR
jgi:hypothetical protein